MTTPLRVAMVGTRGIPARAGGVEHHVEQLATRLVGRGHAVTVYSRTNYVDRGIREVDGVTVRRLPTIGTKHLDAVVHSALASAAASLRSFDVVHFHAMGPSLFAPLPRYLRGVPIVCTVHGIDHDRSKWGSVAQLALRAGAWSTAKVAHETIVVSEDLREHYLDRYGRVVHAIPNGVPDPRPLPPVEITRRFGLTDGYVLFAGRLVPEKAPDLLIEAYRAVPGDRPLVVAGDATFLPGFATRLRDLAAGDARVRLLGFVGGDLFRELLSNAALFVLPSSVEGMPITVMEGASFGLPVVVSDIPPHREVFGGDRPGRRFTPVGDAAALTAVLTTSLSGLESERSAARDAASEILERYRWDRVVSETEAVYAAAVGRGRFS